MAVTLAGDAAQSPVQDSSGMGNRIAVLKLLWIRVRQCLRDLEDQILIGARSERMEFAAIRIPAVSADR